MSDFSFAPQARPFPAWYGPFSPARGVHSGFRFHSGRFGTWVETRQGREFWAVRESSGTRTIARTVLDSWGGGRVLLLPYGLAIKPLQRDEEVGRRALIGRFGGPVVLRRPDGTLFDFSRPGNLSPGDEWPGPTTTGLECTIKADGSLFCQWYHPAPWGRLEVSAQLCGPSRHLRDGFRKARPGEEAGRVRVTADGQVITNRHLGGGRWIGRFVGVVTCETWPLRKEWIGGQR